MSWLSSPRVRLALIVNGLYFISIFTPTPPHTRPRLFARAGERRDARFSTKTPPAYAPLAPPSSATSKAATNSVKDYDQLDVYLTNDLTLVRKAGHTLLFSPTFTTRMSVAEPPRSVLLRFISFSEEQVYSEKTPLLISTNGRYKWDDSWDVVYGPARTNTGRHSVTTNDEGRVVETVGVELPYETFLEIISARQIIIELGPDQVELNADQVEALRGMHRLLPQQLEDPTMPPANQPGRPSGVSAEPKIIQLKPTTRPRDRRH
jgi:hypothetical protein